MGVQRAELTFRYNTKLGRHGWLRLTPAYSVKIVDELLSRVRRPKYVLDPFAGSGTTGLVCATKGINCDLIEINPFLSWLAQVKTQHYTDTELLEAELISNRIAETAFHCNQSDLWIPPMSNVNRWWSENRLLALASIIYALKKMQHLCSSSVLSLLQIAFCKVAINWSNASFNHQSVSLKKDVTSEIQTTLSDKPEKIVIIEDFVARVNEIVTSARQPILTKTKVYTGDSRFVATITSNYYDCVITSPPYPNRISYMREVRPYMYWLGYLNYPSEAGELDWEAIGGTWGVATSRLARWSSHEAQITFDGFANIKHEIAIKSPLLANYVHKYFFDMASHFSSLKNRLTPGAQLFYVIGNSKFYDTIVPAEQIYVSLLEDHGFKNVNSEILRKRNSKKELYEYLVSAEFI
jgi:hypothetical protein